MGRHVLHVHTVQLQPAVFPHLIVVVSVPLGESPLLADKDLLASRELELGAPKSLNTFGLELVMGSDGDEDLTDPDPGGGSMSLAESSSHSSLEPISSCARQHFVDPKHMEGVHANPDVELVFAAVLHEVLVAADTSGLQGLAGQLLQLVGHQVNRQRELINSSLLTSKIEDPDLRVRDTTVEPALGVRLVLAVAIALGRSPTHPFSCRSESSNIS